MLNAMQKAESILQDRKEEVQNFIDYLKHIQNKNTIDIKLFPILKAQAILLLYNYAEGCLRILIEQSFFEKIVILQPKIRDLAFPLQRIWLEQNYEIALFGNQKNDTKNFDKRVEQYRKLLTDAPNQVLAENNFNAIKFLDKLKTYISGNLDARNCRYIFLLLGINLPHEIYTCKCLEQVKNDRNKLAHGEKTFSEIGSSILVQSLTNQSEEYPSLGEDLVGYQTEIFNFFDAIENAIDTFLQNKQYLLPIKPDF